MNGWPATIGGFFGWVAFVLLGLVWLTATTNGIGLTHTLGLMPW